MSEFVGLRIGAVHEEHTVSEYYCGGCGWPVTDHDSYCPECGGALHRHDADSSDADSAKLQELARFIMHQCNDGNQRCNECIGWNDGECVALQRMRELGIEV